MTDEYRPPALSSDKSLPRHDGQKYAQGTSSRYSGCEGVDVLQLFATSQSESPNVNTPVAYDSIRKQPQLADLGSQPIPARSVPHLDFQHFPAYEATGELLDLETSLEAQLNDVVAENNTIWSFPVNDASGLRTVTDPSCDVSTTASLCTDLKSSPLLRPVLKRPSTDPGLQGRDSSSSASSTSRPPKRKRVAFESMSAADEPSGDDADTSSPEPQISDSTIRIGQNSNTTPSTAQSRVVPSAAGGRPKVMDAQSIRSNVPSNVIPPDPKSHERTSYSVGSSSTLLPDKVFPVQVGSELFRLSGASISSDAPSYFTQFFEEQVRANEDAGGVRTLYIDRDSETFKDIARHLQGYYVKPRDGSHFVRLFADAQFYGLPRLIDQLFESEIYIQIGDRHFQIPKDIFSDAGNSPNFFSLGFAVFFSTPAEAFPGLDRRGLLRPPSITPPYVPGKSADIFAQLLHLLRGYPLRIESDHHRAELLQDCRYFHLRGLEQKLIAHEISYNIGRRRSEIALRIEDIKPSGISYQADDPSTSETERSGWVNYSRPFVDESAHQLVLEIGGESMLLEMSTMQAEIQGLAKARVHSLLQVVANKMNLPVSAPLGLLVMSKIEDQHKAGTSNTNPLSEDKIKVRFDLASNIVLDGNPFEIDLSSDVGRRMCNLEEPSPAEREGSGSDAGSVDEVAVDTVNNQQTRSATSRGQSRGRAARGSGTNRIRIGSTTNSSRAEVGSSASKKRRRQTSSITTPTMSEDGEWIIRTGQFRLRLQPHTGEGRRRDCEVVFVVVKLDAFTCEKARNKRRSFLSAG